MRIVAGTDSRITSPELEQDRAAIRAALDEIIGSHWFRNTKRCRGFLQYAVAETLAGRAARLTERGIGVLVFGRSPDYDTNEDGIVRTSALEVRKRLAQYYHELGHGFAVRIEMAPGGYVPDFRLPEDVPADMGSAPRSGAMAVAGSAKPLFRGYAVWIAGVLLLATAALAGWRLRFGDPLDVFWEPMGKGAKSLIIVVGAEPPIPLQDLDPASKETPSTLDVVRTDRTGFADAVVVAQVTGLLAARERHSEVHRASSLTLDDLRKVPAVFIGNTPWTDRLNADLRFQVKRDNAAATLEITDRGVSTPWKVNAMAPYAQRNKDWAVISRFRDPRTEQPVLLLCGLGSDGTVAAGEFVSRPDLLSTFIHQAPVGWRRKNFQIVVEVDLINGSAGQPHVLETYFW